MKALGRFLSDYRWLILTAGAVASFVLGVIGWSKFLPDAYPHRHVNVSDAVYWSFKGFFFNSPSMPGLPTELDISRFLAPVVAGWAGLSAVGLLFRDRIQQMRIPLMRNHVVICGLGDYVGSVFLRQLRDERIGVVVIERDAANPNIELCRSLGVPVIIGDAQRERTLQSAGTQRAWRVLAITPDDAANTQIVAMARVLPGSRDRRCLALVTNPEFCRLLRIQEAQRGDPELSVDFFNIDEISARLLLEDFPLDTDRDQPHIVVAHLDPLGAWLVYHAARAWFDNRGGNPAPLVVTVLDQHARERVEELLSEHPALEKACQFNTFSPTPRDLGRLAEYLRDPATPQISRAYVTAYRDEQVLETALTLRHELDSTVPVVAALSLPQGVASLLDDVKDAGLLTNFEMFSSTERTATVELVRGGSFEQLAHAIHELWRKEQISAGKPDPTWQDVNESRRESSRDQARDIPVKLRMIGCAIAPLRDWGAKDFTFSPAEIDVLAIAEHERWNRDRIASGWTLIDLPTADDPQQAKRLLEEARQRNQTPYLLPWDALSQRYPDVAEFDRMFVREIPSILAAAGLQVIRTPIKPTADVSTEGDGE